MIDLGLLRENPVLVSQKIQEKDPLFPVQKLIDLDQKVREERLAVENLRSKKNSLAQEAKGGLTAQMRQTSLEVGKELKEREGALESLEREFNDLYLCVPNLPDDGLPLGGKDENKVVREFGSKPSFDFPLKNHVELGAALGWFDFEKAASLAASHFALYKGDAVKLMYALTMFMLKNNLKHGFTPILPSVLVNEKTLYTSGNFPKFKDEVFSISADGLYLSPTSEVSLASIYKDQILEGSELPLRMTAWTSCFRREAGGYGANERGLIRIHQFEKVELYSVCSPERSNNELDFMVDCAETILKKLGLHYRVSLLAAQDCSFSSTRTYDIEVWMPAQNQYKEVSSASNCTDFQARRAKIRYRNHQTEKPRLVHTLNASSLALPRLMVALMETYQQPDGSIAIPEILKGEALFVE